jgi:hypothetical protein
VRVLEGIGLELRVLVGDQLAWSRLFRAGAQLAASIWPSRRGVASGRQLGRTRG